jgi:hypothetical protein
MGKDDHIVEERTRTYMGRTTPPAKIEIWIGENAYCYITRTIITIQRFDLKKRYTVHLRNKRYMEEPLEPAQPRATGQENPVRIQELGFKRYVPVYEWDVQKSDREQVINGKKCRLYILNGDADYAEEKRELWVTRDVPIDVDRFFRLSIEPGLDKEWRSVYSRYPELKKMIALESRFATEPSIAPTITWDNKLLKVERTDPPDGVYEVPDGFTRVKSRDELYSR